MKKYLFLSLIIINVKLSYSQTCNCSETFSWLKETFEKNDAGFQYAIDLKGQKEYINHSQSYFQKAKEITDKQQCSDTLFNWLKFFRKGHIWFGIDEEIKTSSASLQKRKKKIQQQFKNWKTFPYKEKEFNNYISKISSAGFEGIWQSSAYTIGVKKVNNDYVGFIIEGDGVYWSKSQIKFVIKDSSDILSATYYMQDHSPKSIKRVELIGSNYLQLDWITLKRVSPIYDRDVYADLYYKFTSSINPIIEKLSNNTIALRIPSFSDSEKSKIDSVISANQKLITSTENLIIDLRGNGGGSDMSFQNLIPLIYTNPISEVGVRFLSTPLNNTRMEEFATNPNFSDSDKKWAKNALDKLNKHIGEFVNVEDSIITTFKLDTIYPFPKNVGIIINEENASTTEQFLLAAKQSKKVKLFGNTTGGILDISNMHFVSSPCGNFKLGYCLSKSNRIPSFAIDGKGIQPDHYIGENIPKHLWLKYVNNILNYK